MDGAKRLCSEIQLFDLCDLDSCRYKDGRFCTNAKLLERFEAVQEDDDGSQYQYLCEGPEDMEEECLDGADEPDADEEEEE